MSLTPVRPSRQGARGVAPTPLRAPPPPKVTELESSLLEDAVETEITARVEPLLPPPPACVEPMLPPPPPASEGRELALARVASGFEACEPPASTRPVVETGGDLAQASSIAPVALSSSSYSVDSTVQMRPRRAQAGLFLAVAAVFFVLGAAATTSWIRVPGSLASRALLERLDEQPKPVPEVARPVAKAAALAEKAIPPAETAARPSPSSVAANAPAAAAPAAAVPAAAAPVPSKPSDIPADRTLVTPPASSKGHRIWVDGRLIGNGPAPFKTKCGVHKLQFGSAGKPHMTQQLPCGERINLD